MKRIAKIINIIIALLAFLPAMAESERVEFSFLERGGTIICKVNGDALFQGKWSNTFKNEEYWSQPWVGMGDNFAVDDNWLKQNLTVEQYQQYTSNSTTANNFFVTFTAVSKPRYGETIRIPMQSRRIGNDYYVIYHSDSEDVVGTIEISLYGINGDTLTGKVEMFDLPNEFHSYNYSRYSDAPAIEYDIDNLHLTLFKTWNLYTLVIREHHADKNFISNQLLAIADNLPLVLEGYMDGEDAVYCCIITSQEASDIICKMPIRLSSSQFNAAFGDTNWGIVVIGQYYGIVNTDMGFVLSPEYTEIERTQNSNIFLCRKGYGPCDVFNAEEQRIVVTIDEDDGLFGRLITVNDDDTFTVTSGKEPKYVVYSLIDGSILESSD